MTAVSAPPLTTQSYTVSVTNLLTAEAVMLSVTSTSAEDAQVDALHRLFHERGWRKSQADRAMLA